MKLETGSLITITMFMTEPEARAFLVDARPTQDQVRDAIAITPSPKNGDGVAEA